MRAWIATLFAGMAAASIRLFVPSVLAAVTATIGCSQRGESVPSANANGAAAPAAASPCPVAGESPLLWATTDSSVPTLARVLPPGQVSVSNCCHILLFYGLGATDLPGFASGEEVPALTDEPTAIRTFGRSPFVVTRHGVRYFLSRDPVFDSDVGEAHRDQCLGTFAALGLPLTAPITIRDRRFTIADLVRESVANFSFEQKELPWTAMAYTEYIAPQKQWQDRFGRQTSFSQLVQHLMRQDPNRASCAGIHNLQALARIDRADRAGALLDSNAKAELHAYLERLVGELVARQQDEGCWDWQWCAAVRENTQLPPLRRRMLVSGHLLEALSSLDIAWQASETASARAANWLLGSLESQEINRDGFWICPVTHAARAARRFAAAGAPH